ncbi:MAG: HIT family protein, partial [Pseudomonadota bacterium]
MTSPAVTATMKTFGHPQTLIAEYEWWAVMLRPAQPTLGALVLAAKYEATAFGALPAPAFAEMGRAIADIEAALTAFRPYAKINYLMLMMKDPEPHFHVVPRYPDPQSFEEHDFADAGWPG